jgi:prolyl 4-hydroxylase
MELQVIVEDYILLVRGFLHPDRCEALVRWSEARGFEEALLSSGRRREEIRNNDRILFDDGDLADEMWSLVGPFVPSPGADGAVAVGLNERFRFYRYHPGQRFAPHTDGSFRRDDRERSRFTFMVYLNGDLEGGETRFRRIVIPPVQGCALLFRHEIEHEGCEVTRGVKYVLRSDVMFRSPPS